MKINRRISSNIELFEEKINYEFKNKEFDIEWKYKSKNKSLEKENTHSASVRRL